MNAVSGRPQRVMIVGSGGAGKSTLAVELGELLGLPVVHLDREFWSAGWVPTPPELWGGRLGELVAAPRWVIDGNYGSSLDVRLDRADLVVFLDLPRRVTIPAVLRRWVRWYGRTRPDMHPGCPERFSWEFATWLWNYPRHSRPRLLAAIRTAGVEQRMVRLRSRRAVQLWLHSVAA